MEDHFTSAVRSDAMNRIVGTIAPDPDGAGPLHHAATRTTYDAAGRAVSVEKGELAAWQPEDVAPAAWSGFTVFQTVSTTYDAMDRKLTETVSAGGTAYALAQHSYDSSGRLECTAVRMNPAAFGALPASACTLGTEGSQGPDRITRNVYDAAGQLTKVQKAYGTGLQQDYASYQYSLNGKQVQLTDANGNPAAMAYDGFDPEVQWSFPSTSSPGTVSTTDYEAYAYDPNGNRTSLRKRDGSVIAYSYDALNRVTVKDLPGGTAADVYYSYDTDGHQLSARFGSSSGSGVSQTYDGFGRLASATNDLSGAALTLSYQYDEDGNRIRVTHPDGTFFTFDHDGLDRQVAVKENGAALVASVTYDNQGRRGGDTRGAVATSYGYDPVSRVASIADDLAGTASDVTTTLAYNPAGQIVSRGRSNDAYAFGSYLNVSRSYAVNGLNQYTTAGPATFSYDANGNLTGDGTSIFGYDVENRLVSRSGGLALAYDPDGRLWQTSGGARGTTRYLYDGDELAAEYDGAGNLLRRYVHGPGEDDPILWYEGAGLADRRSLQVDHQGSIVSIADASGNAIAINAYDEYGIPGAPNQGRFQYTGQAWLPDLGMYYYKARIYSPTLGRFLQTDPIGYKDQVNLYAYVGNDPVDRRDPSGELARGAGFDDKEWKTFNKWQQHASKDMDNKASKLLAKADKLDAKGKRGSDVLRREAHNLSAGAAALRDTSSAAPVANLIADAAWSTVHPTGQDYQAYTKGRVVDFRNSSLGIFGGVSNPLWIIGHEGVHAGAHVLDQLGPNGFPGYLHGKPPMVESYYKLRGTMTGADNPDNLMGLVYGD